MIRSSNVSDFLGKNSVPALVQDALAKSKLDDSELNKEEERIAIDKNCAEEEKLSALAKSTGLSIETLKIIQAKQNAIKEQREHLDKTIIETSQKKFQQLSRLADMIRQILNSKMKTTLSLRELLVALNDTQRGIF